ncbi:3-oxo-5-alpha-steroid 4-dehydrogenase-domain-containing protein [Mycena olivaceomarginata]|nr:3-oxo-5-alpha-steroid 4-dehydrogenase-domain-containing protein [Mycena olivaceomarginata]
MEAPTAIQVKVTATRKKTSLLRSLKLPLTLSFPPSPPPTVRDVKAAIQQAHPSFYAARQKISLPETPKSLPDESAILFDSAGEVELTVADLGPQVEWITVFIIEYLGPLLVHPLVYHLPKLFYGVEVEHSALQKSVYAWVLIHYLKREFETFFVHRFSHATMPWTNLPKNSGHYWFLSGLFLAYDVYRPAFSAPSVAGTWQDGPLLTVAWVVWAYAQLSNLSVHLYLRSLRPAGTTTRVVPMGYGFTAPFNLAFPNYFFELLAWTTVLAITGSLAALVFVIVSAVQMSLWAAKKHRTYKKEFGDKYPRNRRVLFPLIF